VRDAPVDTTCPYCGVGCGVRATPLRDGSVAIEGDKRHPANFGRLCSKGSALGETIGLEDRLLHPEIAGARTSWDTALALVADKFSDAIETEGPDSVAFYVSGQFLSEDYYVANKLMKGFIGSGNIDTNSRLCMASSVAGHRRAFGADTVPGTYEDLELADLVVLVGSNLAWCHPVLYQRIAAAKVARPGMKVVLVDPRRTMTADLADMHLALKPDGDCALFAGLLTYLAQTGSVDEDFVGAYTNGFAAAFDRAASLGKDDLLRQTGLSEAERADFYALFAATEKTVTVYSQGVNQSSSGADKVNAIINCHLATGRIGRPGMGPFSVTGQPNAMGGREVGGLANMLAAHMEIENSQHRAWVEKFWNAPSMVRKPGLKAVDMFQAVADGRIKALWIMATNPVDSLPDAGAVEAAIKACPFVVVSDISRRTDTVRHAHVRLPSAAWGEKDGTVTNSERRISRQRRFQPLAGEARPDWWQLAEVAKRMGFAHGFDFSGPADIFREHAALSGHENGGSRDFDIGAYADIDNAEFDALEPFQWPQAKGATAGDSRFFAKGGFFTPDRRARFVAVTATNADLTSAAYPLTLNTGRVRDHWHTMTRTAKSARLSAHMAEPFCEIHPHDAEACGIAQAEIVEVESRYGVIRVRALITARQQPGSVFVPMHWTDQYAAAARVDRVVAPRTDPISGQPALKNTAVALRRFPTRLYGFAVCRTCPDSPDAPYWAKAKCSDGWRIELAFDGPPGASNGLVANALGLDTNHAGLSYIDRERNQQRFAWFDGETLTAALFLSAAPVEVSRSWAVEQLGKTHGCGAERFRLAAGRPGGNVPDRGALVCSCFSVGANEIAAAVRAGCVGVDAIGKALKAGTNCGSCRSEISGIIHEHHALAAE